MQIENVAKIVDELADVLDCSYVTVWDKYTHPEITDKFKFDEVLEYLEGREEQC